MWAISIMAAIFSLFSWLMTYLCLREKGLNVYLVSGYMTMNKADRVKEKAKYDVIAMNRYSGRMIYWPLSVLLSMLVPLPFLQTVWYGVLVGIGSIIVVVMCFMALPKLLGTKFEIKK